MENTIYLTNGKTFTLKEFATEFKNLVHPYNYEQLEAHLCEPTLAPIVEGFAEQNGVLFLVMNSEMISVTPKINEVLNDEE